MGTLFKNCILFRLLLILSLQFGTTSIFSAPFIDEKRGDRPDEVVIEQQQNLETQELEVELAVAYADQNESPIQIQTKRGHIYKFEYINSGEIKRIDTGEILPASTAYGKLNEEDKLKFQERRLIFLTHAATILDRTNLIVGFGRLTKNKMKVLKDKLLRRNPIDELSREILPDDQETPQNLRMVGATVIQGLLATIDRQIWAAAPLLISNNEISIAVGVAPKIEGGSRNHGAGGATGIGINIGYNYDLKASVFEIITTLDKFKQALTPFFTVGISKTVGINFRNVAPGTEMQLRVNSRVNLPGHGFVSHSPTSFTIGYNSPFYSFPDLFGVANFFSYLSTTFNKPILRLEYVGIKSKFIRVHTGVPKIATVKNFLIDIKTWTKKIPARCAALLE